MDADLSKYETPRVAQVQKMSDSRAMIENHGQIENLPLPKDWVESNKKFASGIGARSFRAFHPKNDEKVALCLFYRGLAMSPTSSEAFHDLLEKKPHPLDLSELASIKEVLRDKKNPADFTIKNAETKDVSGKRVLVVEGRYKELQEDATAMFIDADGTGRFVQEVYYQTPKGHAPESYKAAKDSMFSIRWKENPAG